MLLFERSAATGPGHYFAKHPVAFRLSVAGSAGAATYAAVRAAGAQGDRRILWIALALIEGAITAGIIRARDLV